MDHTIGQALSSAITPSLLLDRDRVAANAAAMSARCQAAGVALRPHVKTARCVEAMALAHGGATARESALGYGLVCDLSGRPYPGLRLTGLSQEHGWVRATEGEVLPFAALPVGARVRILPSLSCTTAAAWPAFAVVQGQAVVGSRQRAGGW